MSDSNSFSGPHQIIGLRMEGSADDELDHLFSSSDSGNETFLEFTPEKHVALKRMSTSLVLPEKVKSFNDVNSTVSSLIASLQHYVDPSPYKGDIDFIPEGTSHPLLQNALREFVTNRKIDDFLAVVASLEQSCFTESILVQIDMIKFFMNIDTDLLKHSALQVDSRISSLLHFLLLEKSSPDAALPFCIKSATEYVKTLTLAPISVLFPSFKLDQLIMKLSSLLFDLFPKHPLVPSVLHKLGGFSNNKDSIIGMLTKNVESDESDDFSDSFLEDLAAIRKNGPPTDTPTLSTFNEPDLTNPLEIPPTLVPLDVVVLPDTPATMTILIDGNDKFSPNGMVSWLQSIQLIGIESGLTGFPLLYQTMFNGEDFKKFLPKQVGVNDWGQYLVPLHYINTISSSPYIHGSISPELLQYEINCHQALEEGNNEVVDSYVRKFCSFIPREVGIKSISPLNSKRDSFINHKCPYNTEYEEMVALTDIALVFYGRSPMSLAAFDGSHQRIFDPSYHPILNNQVCISELYRLYSTLLAPPYVLFRAGFAIGVSLLDHSPNLALRFLFESYFILIKGHPQLSKSIWSRIALLTLGEAFEMNSKYYYCAICHDIAWMNSKGDRSLATRISKVSRKNQDLQRAVFYSIESLKYFIVEKRFDEEVYCAQGIAEIFRENGQIYEGIQVLFSILRGVYNLTVPSVSQNINTSPAIRKRKVSSEGSPQRNSIAQRGHPKASAINTIMTALTLCEFLIKANQFRLANYLISQIAKSVSIASITKMLSFIEAKISIVSNDYEKFLSQITQQQLVTKNRPRSMTTKLISFNPIMMDTVGLSLKLLAKTYILQRHDYFIGLFWSEMLCFYGQRMMSPKDVGNGFFLRGTALLNLYHQRYLYGSSFSIQVPLSSYESSFGIYCTDGNVDESVLLTEALSSFSVAISTFDRIGNTPKVCQSLLSYCQLLAITAFENLIISSGNQFSIVVSSPLMFTAIKSGYQSVDISLSFDSVSITNSSIVDHLSSYNRRANSLTRILMNPVYIIQSQLVSTVVFLLKAKTSQAQSVFDQAYTNIRDYFFNGQRFLPRELKRSTLFSFHDVILFMTLVLTAFDSSIIDERIIVFDMLNDVISLARSKSRSISCEPQIELDYHLTIPSSITELRNPGTPDFSAILPPQPRGHQKHEKVTIEDILQKIKSNIRLFAQEKLTQKKLIDKNSALCRKILSIGTELRKSRHSLMLTELPVTSQTSVLYAFRLYVNIFTYIPASGNKRYIPLQKSNSGTINVKTSSLTVQLITGSNLFSQSFLTALAHLVYPNATPKKSVLFGDKFKDECTHIKNLLFGDIRFTKLENTLQPDDDMLNESRLFGKGLKGSLLTISVQPTPLMIISDPDLQIIPYEYLFRECSVVRSNSFFSTTFRTRAPRGMLHPVVFNRTYNPEDASFTNNERSTEIVSFAFSGLGAMPSQPFIVRGEERNFTFPIPIPDKSVKEYPFIAFRESIEKSNPEDILLLTYADLLEWPITIDRIVNCENYYSFLFVPGAVFIRALNEMKLIYERHQRRSNVFSGDQNPEQRRLLDDPFQFSATLQHTLMQKLKVPVILFIPNRSL